MYNMNITFDHRIGMHPTSEDPNNVRRAFHLIMESQKAIDVAYIEALCHLLLVDYVCFNYPLPRQCKHHENHTNNIPLGPGRVNKLK